MPGRNHDRQADEGHHGRVEQGNPVADNPEHQQADNDDDGLDLVRLRTLVAAAAWSRMPCRQESEMGSGLKIWVMKNQVIES